MQETLNLFTKIIRQLDPQKRENLAGDITRVTMVINAAGAAPSGLESSANEALLAEVARRGLLTELHGAVGALYDNLSSNGILDSESNTTSYLAYRLRREDAKLTDSNGASRCADFWQQKIDAVGSGAVRPTHTLG